MEYRHMSMRLLYGIVGAFLVSTASLVWAERLMVSSKVANIRSGPGTKYETLWQIEQFHPINIVEKKGNWYRFTDFEGDQGWVHRSLLKKGDAVITAKEKCNVRTGPSTKKAIAFTVGKGIPFKVLKRKGNWIHIVHSDGDKGWIHKSLIW
jgi:SH3-like domain-containing protein